MKNSSVSLTWSRPYWLILAVFIGGAYMVCAFTPLRLTKDGLSYFALTECLLGTWPVQFGSIQSYLPHGYVYLLATIQKVGILTPLTVCIFHFAYLAGSLYFISKIFDLKKPLIAACLIMLNLITIKCAITPLSEMQFLFFTTGALYFFHAFMLRRKVINLFWIIIFCAASILTRIAGVILIVSLLLSFLILTRQHWQLWLKQHRGASIVIASVIIVLLIVIGMQDEVTTYMNFFFEALIADPFSFFKGNIEMHLKEWAELLLNVPFTKASFAFTSIQATIIYVAIGALFLWFVSKRLIAQKQTIPLHIGVYIIIYALFIFNWPYYDARFWFPLIPILIPALLKGREQAKSQVSFAEITCVGCYITSGVLVLCYYMNQSLDRQALSNRHDGGLWKKEYDYHFGFANKNDTTGVNRQALYILEKYDR